MRTVKRMAFCIALAGGFVFGLGNCSLKSIGAGMLSEFLTTGGTNSLNSAVNSGLGTLVNQLTGTATSANSGQS